MAQKRMNKRQQRLERQRRIKKKRRKRLAIILIEIVILAGLGVVAYGMFVMDKMDTTTLNKDKLEVYKDTGDYTNIALFGLDSREGELDGGVQSDCIMVASINNKTNEIKLVSVYRDTLMKVTSEKYGKANSAYNSVNFNALADVVDALGGIEIDMTEEEVYWTNGYCTETSKVVGRETTELSGAGVHKLDGVQAVSYARIRYTEGMDFKRTQRQRIVLEKIAEKAQKANVITLNNIVNKVMPQISTNLSTANMLGLAAHAADYKLGQMSGFPFEVTTCEKVKNHKGSYVTAVGLEKNVSELHEFLFGEEDYEPSATVKDISNEVIYMTGVDPETYKTTTDYTYKSGGDDSEN